MRNVHYFSEASMEDSFLYKTFNDSNNITYILIGALKNGTVLTKDNIEEQYFQIKRYHLSPLNGAILNAFDNGDIELIHAKANRTPISLPFIIRGNGNSMMATVFLSSFSEFKEDGTINMPLKNLYVLMESAYIALQIQKDPNKLKSRLALQKICNNIYTNMVLRILNRDYALSLDKLTYNKVIFVISKFFSINIWESVNHDIAFSYAASLCVSPNMEDLRDVDEEMKKANIKDISDLLDFLKTVSPRLESANIRYFMDRWIYTYGPSATLSLDYLPYLMFVIIATYMGTFLISQNALSGIVKETKGMNLFYQELSRLY